VKVCKFETYDPQFPEKFNWSLIDSHKLDAIAQDFASRIRAELELPSDQRLKIAGLRYALNIIAGTADIY